MNILASTAFTFSNSIFMFANKVWGSVHAQKSAQFKNTSYKMWISGVCGLYVCFRVGQGLFCFLCTTFLPQIKSSLQLLP